MPPAPAHGARRPWGAPVTGRHWPTWPGTSHASHWPAHSPPQHTPSTQKPVVHWAADWHAAPAASFGWQRPPAAQWKPAAHSAWVAHRVRHAAPLQA